MEATQALIEAAAPLIDAALREDLDEAGDLTAVLLDPAARAAARIVPRRSGVICGLPLVEAVCERWAAAYQRGTRAESAGAAERIRVECFVADGESVAAGACLARLHGPTAALVSIERTALNFLGRLSGVATLTREFARAVQAVSPHARVYDTRKTTPGWRRLEKYAVRCGGGMNHRMGLYDAVLLKDNHLADIPLSELASRLERLLARLAQGPARPAFVEVEVDNLAQLREVLRVRGLDIILLDNFTAEELRAAVVLRNEAGLAGVVALEASGGVTLANVAELAAAGVERIAIGALTHSAPSLDIGLDFESARAG